MKWGIASKIAAIFSALALVGTLIVGLVITEGSRVLLMDASAKRLSHTAQIVQIRFTDVLQALRSDAAFLTRTPAVQNMAAKEAGGMPSQAATSAEVTRRELVEASFQAFLESRPWYQAIGLTVSADNARELVRVERDRGGIVVVPESQLNQQNNALDFRRAMALPKGQLYLSPVALKRVGGLIIEPHLPLMRAAMPVDTLAGNRFGVLHISINMGLVFEVLDDLVDPEAALYITNQQGDFLRHPDLAKSFGFDLGHRYTLPQQLPQTKALFSGAKEAMLLDDVQWQAKEPQIGYFERFVIDQGKQTTFLVIGVTSARAVVLSEVNAVRRRSAAYTLLFALAGIGLVLFVSHRLTAPLRQITRAVARFSRGDSHVPLPYGGGDEIGILADNFRLLAERVTTQVRDLEEKEARLRSIIDTAVDGIIVINEEGKVEAFNPGAERIFGYRAAEVMGRNVNMLMASPDREQHDEYIRRYLETAEAHIIGIGRIVTGRHKEGHTIPLYLSIGEFLQSGERKFTGILHDISRDQLLYHTSGATAPS
ncbi:MAG: PAS domain S-box protein [Gammaproteobacteria bacterium]|jgi:PAS domain S-box-containing protein